MSETDSVYVHGTRPEEQSRLALLNGLLNERALEQLRLRGSERVLEMGAGLGLFARRMAAALPNGSVLAIERSTEQIAEARRLATEAGEEGSFELRRGDALEPPLRAEEWSSFDLAHARFLLEHLRDPLRAVRGMVAALRPGGRLVLCDDDHSSLRLDPEPEGVLDLWERYWRHYSALGNDPLVGRRLARLAREAGARIERTDMLYFGGAAGEPHFGALVENLAGVVGSARESLIEAGVAGAGEFDATIERLRDWGRGAEGALWYALPWVEAVRV